MIIIFFLLVITSFATTVVYHTTQQEHVFFNQAESYFKKGKYEEAIPLYEKALQINPFRKHAIENLAYSYQWTNRHKKAIEFFKKATSQEPVDYKNKIALADTLSWEASYGEAIPLYLEAIAATADIRVKEKLAKVYAWAGEYGKAQALIDEIVKIEGQRREVMLLAGEVRQGIDYAGLLAGKYDQYITDFSRRLKAINKTVFIRFAHEPNGDWYPWCGVKIGAERIIAMQRYLQEAFMKNGCANVKWVFCVNWEDVPKENNDFMQYYPGNRYVDYCGIDGYNWGSARPWSSWRSFQKVFIPAYKRLRAETAKPVLISEFASASKGGDKAQWIKDALREIKSMRAVRGFVLFNVDKEADWAIPPQSAAAGQFKRRLSSSCFKDSGQE